MALVLKSESKIVYRKEITKMKTFHKVCVAFLLLTAILNSSCKKFLNNVSPDPNNPYDVPINTLLAPVQTSLGYVMGGDLAQFPGIIMQEVTGALNQQKGYQIYQFVTDDFGSSWSNLYVGVLENLKILQTKADQGHFATYSGITRILSAYTLSTLVDCWNDIPDNEALQGTSNIDPHYNTGHDVYTDALSRLDSGIIYLGLDPGNETPTTDDIMYGGSQNQWIKFAHSLKARLLLHESNLDPSKLPDVITEAQSGFISNNDDAQVPFGAQQQNSNPMYQFNQQRGGNISFTIGFLFDTLRALSDPRGSAYPSQFFLTASSPVWLMTYHELEFIKAEAEVKMNIADSIDLRNAIVSDMLKVNIDTTSFSFHNYKFSYWLSQSSSLTQAQKLYRVMLQKYLSNYLQMEGWSDWRRTGIPFLVPKDGNAVPRRFLYPTAELQSNPNTPQGVTLLSPIVWWD